MPHAHCLFILKNKITAPRDIDEVVWAEIPCPIKYPVLHKIVSKCNIHDPCDERLDAPCVLKGEGTCYRRFPKAFNSETTIIGNGYPQYRRRGRFNINRDGKTITDQWVVPFNPLLSETFDCHINVEVAAHRRCFKYVYKYCFKSPDSATIVIDEIKAYLSGRLLTASEAVWRLLGLKLHKEFPSVMRLSIHLPDQQQVIFDPTQDVQDIFEAAESASSTLLEWFELNKRDPAARNWLYRDIPEHYIWDKDMWKKRTYASSIAVGRIYNVSIHNYELFALRTLLQCVRGCTSFADILTVDGHIYSTFREACSAFGYVHDDSEFVASFQEFLETQVVSVHGLRFQFAFMLLNIKTVDAMSLFEHFAADLCEGDVTPDSRTNALFEIEQIMQKNGKSLADEDFGFDLTYVPDVAITVDAYVENDNLPALSLEQQSAMNALLNMAQHDSSCQKILPIIATAGTGKSVFVNVAVKQLRLAGFTSLCVAASALAATLLPNGKTAHAALKIPIKCHEHSYCSWNLQQQNAIQHADVLFWDEISMVSKDIVDCVDRSLQKLMDNDIKFGGKIVVFLGDFRQLAPVVEHGQGHLHSLLLTEWFPNVPAMAFTRNFRANNDMEFSQFLADVGDGKIDVIDVPESSITDDIEDLIHSVYGHNITDASNNRNMILAYTLDQCAIINDRVFDKIGGETAFSVAVDDLGECRTPDDYPVEYIQSLHITGAPPASLALKIGARYMIMRNCNPPAICNGVLAELISHTRYLCKMRLLTGPGQSRIVFLPRCSFRISFEQSGLPFNFSRRQFPLTPAYCVTVHKSQGQTLSKIGIVVETDAFAHGQVYVALSRVGSWSSISFYSPKGEHFINNKVCREIMSALH